MAISRREVFLFMDWNMNTTMMNKSLYNMPVRFSYVPGSFVVSIISIISIIISIIIIRIIPRSGTT